MFSDTVIEAARRLHELRPRNPKDWMKGDWFSWIEQDEEWDEEDEPQLIINLSAEYSSVSFGVSSHTNMSRIFWIPHRATDWMEQEEWPEDWYLSRNTWIKTCLPHFEVVNIAEASEISTGMIEAFDDDPLSACAKAWLKAVEDSPLQQGPISDSQAVGE